MNGYRAIREDALDLLIQDAINHTPHQHQYPVIVNEELDFDPDPDLGEGEATEEEENYRRELLLLLAGLYPMVTRIVKGKGTVDQKMGKIDAQLLGFQKDANKIIKSTTNQIFRDAVEDANKTLQGFKDNLKDVQGSQAQLRAIQGQQQANLEDIINTLRGKLNSGLWMDEVNEAYEGDPTYDYLEGAFATAQSRIDGMGMYGYLQSNAQGGLTALMAGAVILGSVIVADWVTVGDDNVCEDCQDLEDGSPYPIMAWPEEPHYGCRCSRENERLQLD